MKRTGMKRNSQSGLSMLEIMVAVAVIGILAKIALPSLAGSSRKVKGDSEVNSFMAELRIRQEQFHLENGRYLSTSTSEAAMFPPTAQPTEQTIPTLPYEWNLLRVTLPSQQARCQYVTVAGSKLSGSVGTIAASKFNFTAPPRDWYYVLAHCDLDGSATKDAYYFTSSIDSSIQKVNAGN